MRTDRELTALFAGVIVEERADPMFLDELFELLVDEVASVGPAAVRRPLALARWSRAARWPVLIAAGIVITILSFGVLLIQTPNVGPQASPTPTPIVLSNSFTARAHAYAGALPAGWSVTLGATESEPDTFIGPEGTLTVRFSIIPRGTSQDAWSTARYNSIVAGLGGSCLPGNVDGFIVGRVGPDSSLRYGMACLPGWLDLTAVGDRAYDIRFTARSVTATAADLELYRQILLAFVLDQGPTITATPAPLSTLVPFTSSTYGYSITYP